MQTVIETPAYLASTRDTGLTDDERDEIVTFLARYPDAGDLMPGTGGARKLRFASRGLTALPQAWRAQREARMRRRS